MTRKHWFPNEEGKSKLQDIVDKIKKDTKGQEFNCIVGLSGGADSSYMLHSMVRDYGLNPLVFHVDGGWNSELAVNNIYQMVNKLNLDLLTEVINWPEMRDFQLSMFKSGVPHLDTPQDMAFIAVLYKFAKKIRLNTYLMGGNISTECVKRPDNLIYWGLTLFTSKIFETRFGTVKLETFPLSSAWHHKFILPFFYGTKVVKPLNFMNYNKAQAVGLLQREYQWKPYKQKHFRSRFTRFFEGFWLKERFNFDMRTVDLSSLILTGQMSREEAMSELSKPALSQEEIDSEFTYIADKLEISEKELQSYLEMPKRYYWDYKNQDIYFKIGASVISLVSGTTKGGAY